MELTARTTHGAHAQRARPATFVRSVPLSRLVYGGTAAYALLFVGAAALHYFAFAAGRLDLGNMVQAIWSTAHGNFLQVSSDAAGRNVVRLGAHVDPFLVLLVPLWWVWSSPLMLVVVQALAVAAGALPVFWLARKHLGEERLAAGFAAAYLLYPATQFNTFTVVTGFHAVSFAVPLVLYAIWFLDGDRLLPFAACALLAASTKEEIALAVGCLGLWYAVSRGRWRVGLAIFTAGVAVTLVNFLVIIPHYAPSGTNPFAGRYAEVGGTPTGIAHRALTDPVSLLHVVATWHKLGFLVLLLLPFLGLWARTPLLFVGALPDLAINLLSSKPEQTQIGYHYTAGIVPFVVAASVVGLSRVRAERRGTVLCGVLALVTLLAISTPLAFVRRDARLLTTPGLRAAKVHALRLIPAGVPVTASDQLGAYLSNRRVVSVYPFGLRGDWAILDRNDSTYPSAAGYRRAVERLLQSPRWRQVYSSHGVVVLRKRGS